MSSVDPVTQTLIELGVLSRKPGAIGPGPMAMNLMWTLYVMGVQPPSYPQAVAWQKLMGDAFNETDFEIPDNLPEEL